MKPLKTARKTFPVTGMHCAVCAGRVDKVLHAQEGVAEARVNFAAGTVWVEYDPTVTSPEVWQEALRKIGFGLIITEEKEAVREQTDGEEHDFRHLRMRTLCAWALALPVCALHWWGTQTTIGNITQALLAAAVVFGCGATFFSQAWTLLRQRSCNMDTLVALSTGTAFVFSLFHLLLPIWSQATEIHTHLYFEAAAMPVAFVLLGRMLEGRARCHTTDAIRRLSVLQPDTVTLVRNGREVTLPLAEVKLGDVLRVKPGERLAVDGMVMEGASYVDESTLTGESMPVLKTGGERVYAGTLNGNGSFTLRAESVGSATQLGRLIALVQEAQGSRPPIQRLTDRIASVFTPAILTLACSAWAAWWMFGGQGGFEQGLQAFVTVLIIACPCALGLATPTAITVGIGWAAERGILIRDAVSLEVARTIDSLVVDKTGTLTEGAPAVSDAWWGETDPKMQSALLALELCSEHPTASALVKHLSTDITPAVVTSFENLPGRGIRGEIEGVSYLAGNLQLLEEHQLTPTAELANLAMEWEDLGAGVVYFATSTEIVALFAVTDCLRPKAPCVVHDLQQRGIRVTMLTGDGRRAAHAVAEACGIKDFRHNVLPRDKAEAVKALQAAGHRVTMVGDGINDSAALALADLGIAMGRGSDIARHTAAVTLMGSDLRRLPEVFTLSNLTVRTIHQNLFWAFIYNLICLPVAAGALVPFGGFTLPPMWAAASMALSSLCVVSNSLLLRRRLSKEKSVSPTSIK